MRRNQRGPGMSVGVDYLAKKWKLDESDIKGALVECGLQIPADENAKPVYVEFEGDLFWVNINRRGEIWINMREKPQPVFRVVQGQRVADEDAPADNASRSEPVRDERREERRDDRRESRREERERAREQHDAAPPEAAAAPAQPAAPKTFLDRIRAMMRRNRRGHGWSGSFAYLTKALKTDDTGLLAQLAEHGLKLKADGEDKPLFHEEGDFLYWMDKNQRGEIWINARKNRGQAGEAGASDDDGSAPAAATGGEAPADAPGEKAAPAAEPPVIAAAPARVPAHTLGALRLLLQPKKRGEGFTAKVDDLAAQLERPAIEILEALVAAGLNVPDDTKTKPTFGEHNGEIFWLNRNAKGDLWLNAKDSKARRARTKKKSDDGSDAAGEGDGAGDGEGDE
jgi:hypothetical protein